MTLVDDTVWLLLHPAIDSFVTCSALEFIAEFFYRC